MDEQTQGNQRGNIPDGSTNQKGKASGYFQANGLEHFSFSPKTIISWGVLSGLVGLITASIVVYRSFGTQVDERITNHRELNRSLDKHSYEIQTIKDVNDKQDDRIKDLENYARSRKK